MEYLKYYYIEYNILTRVRNYNLSIYKVRLELKTLLKLNLYVYFYLFLLLEIILETSNNSKIEHSIYNVLRKHFLEQRSITWKPIKVELIVNPQLTDDFFGKYFFQIIIRFLLFSS